MSVCDASGWIVLRAWNEDADPLVFDLYPYATTSPVYIEVAGSRARSAQDAAYFVRWMDRVISAARSAQTTTTTRGEKQETLEYLRAAAGLSSASTSALH